MIAYFMAQAITNGSCVSLWSSGNISIHCPQALTHSSKHTQVAKWRDFQLRE